MLKQSIDIKTIKEEKEDDYEIDLDELEQILQTPTKNRRGSLLLSKKSEEVKPSDQQ